MENYIVAIDFSASRVALVAARCDADKPYGIEEVYRAEAKAEGIVRRGVVSNKVEAQRALKSLFTSKQLPKAVEGKSAVYYCMSINGSVYHTTSSTAKVAKVVGGKMNAEVVGRLISEAKDNCSLNAKQEIVGMVPCFYNYDGLFKEFTLAEGRQCESVEASYTVTLANKEVAAVMRTLGNFRVDSLYTTTSSRCVRLLTPEQKENGVAFIDFGATTTNVAVFYKGALQYDESITLGSDLITADIAAGLDIDKKYAESLKHKCGILPDEAVDKKKMTVQFEEGGEQTEKEFLINNIKYYAAARAEELISYVDSCLNKCEQKDRIRRFVLAGGGARLSGMYELFVEKISNGKPVDVVGMPLADEAFACALGMASRFAREHEKEFTDRTNLEPELFDNQAKPAQEPTEDEKHENTDASGEKTQSDGGKSTSLFGKLINSLKNSISDENVG